MEFVLIEAGSFDMGRQAGEEGWPQGEERHPVTLTRAFFLQTTTVTQGQWNRLWGAPPPEMDPKLPVKNVSWFQAGEFLERLGTTEGHSGYRLPSEAEWEYACRAGSPEAWCFGNDASLLDQYAWYLGNAGEQAHPVALKKPNPWGLFDMHGNVWEWCQDVHGPYPSGPAEDPSGPPARSPREEAALKRIIRGGNFLTDARFTRCAARNWSAPRTTWNHVGFRAVLDVGIRG